MEKSKGKKLTPLQVARKERRYKWWSQKQNGQNSNREEKREGLRKRETGSGTTVNNTAAPSDTKNKGGFQTSNATRAILDLKNSSMKVEMKTQTKLNFKKVKSATDNTKKTSNNDSITKKKKPTAATTKAPEAQPNSYVAGEMSQSKHIAKNYVLFIGNLPYSVTKEQLEEHFRKTGGVKTIRIPTDKATGKCKGFAYIEFKNRISHGIALRLHHTTLGGRKINVEFTSIGGNSRKRLDKLKMKNLARANFKMPLEDS